MATDPKVPVSSNLNPAPVPPVHTPLPNLDPTAKTYVPPNVGQVHKVPTSELTEEEKVARAARELEEKRAKARDGVRKQVEDAAAAHLALERKFAQEDEDERRKKSEEAAKLAEARK